MVCVGTEMDGGVAWRARLKRDNPMDMLLHNPNPKLRVVIEFLQLNQRSIEKRIAGEDPKIMDDPEMAGWKGHCEGELAMGDTCVMRERNCRMTWWEWAMWCWRVRPSRQLPTRPRPLWLDPPPTPRIRMISEDAVEGIRVVEVLWIFLLVLYYAFVAWIVFRLR